MSYLHPIAYLRQMGGKMEILAPGGDIDAIKAAIVAGADAVYCGLNKFNARNRAENVSFDDWNGILNLAHQYGCKVYLTLNISIVEQEIPDLFRWLNRLVNTSVDGVIVQDLGLFYLLNKYYKRLKIHASTQLTTHNSGQIEFLNKLGVERVNLSRELNINQIKYITTFAGQLGISTEVFIHGSYCISFSGICYMSSFLNGNSGNRGRCSQPCRDEYCKTKQGRHYPLNLKDNSSFFNLKDLMAAGVHSIKIEGRIKQFHYVYTLVEAYRKQLERIYMGKDPAKDNSMLYKVFNRNFSSGYLNNKIGKEMFIDQPRDYSSTHLALEKGTFNQQNLEWAEQQLFKEKGVIRKEIRDKIDILSVAQVPLNLKIAGKAGVPLSISITYDGQSHVFVSSENLQADGKMAVNQKMLMKRLKAINETAYYIYNSNWDDLESNVYLSFKELKALKNKIIFHLMGNQEKLAPVPLPKIEHRSELIIPGIDILLDSKDDVNLCNEIEGNCYFQLPSAISLQLEEWIAFFKVNRRLIPWFQPVLMEEDYKASINFLKRVKPTKIVSNNTGVGYSAKEQGIPWIAGPNINSMNSYSLQCLKEHFGCEGAFLSNELNKIQLGAVKSPFEFNLYYSIFHPIELMTSLQCLFQTSVGCEKEVMDRDCLGSCSKVAMIENLKKEKFYLHKRKGDFHTVYFEKNYLNLDVVTDIPSKFSGFLIDLRMRKTKTKIFMEKKSLIDHFMRIITKDEEAKDQLKQMIHNTTNQQYSKGV